MVHEGRYVASLQARGKDAAYIDGVFVNINTGTFFISMIAILVCAVLAAGSASA